MTGEEPRFESTPQPGRRARARRRRRRGWAARAPRIRLGAVVALALAVGLITWFATQGGGHSTTTPDASATTKVVPISPRGLVTLSAALKQPIYWAGPEPGDTYELTQVSNGKVYIRYLPRGVKLGANKALLTVGTYPLADAFAVTQQVAGRIDSVRVRVAGGGVAFYGKSSPTNVYLAYPGSDFQVEVFDPSATRARELVASGRVAQVKPSATAPPAAFARAVSLTALKAFAHSPDHPLFWAGTQAGSRYELTQTPSGQIFIRYLPQGTRVGSDKPFLTVGTYPMANAFTVTRRLAGEKSSVRFEVGQGGIGFYDRTESTNVYLAFPGSGYQIEIYDPSPSKAQQLARSGLIVPVEAP
jgi:hypothetical protein